MSDDTEINAATALDTEPQQQEAKTTLLTRQQKQMLRLRERVLHLHEAATKRKAAKEERKEADEERKLRLAKLKEERLAAAEAVKLARRREEESRRAASALRKAALDQHERAKRAAQFEPKPELMGPAMRLRKARLDAGYDTASSFARALGISVTTYSHQEVGRRFISPEAARLYASFLRISPTLILYGLDLQRPRAARIIGKITGHGRVELMPHPDKEAVYYTILGATDDVGEMDCLEVVGNDNYPAYRDGEIVCFERLDEDLGIDPAVIDGQDCIVMLEGGERLLRQVAMQPSGLATLTCFDSERGVLRNVKLRAATPVISVHKRAKRSPRRRAQGRAVLRSSSIPEEACVKL